MRSIYLALASLSLFALSSACASAAFIQPVPSGIAASSATALFRISSDYLGSTGTQPFAAEPFTLQAYVPDQVTYYHPFSRFPDTFSLTVSGSYTNDGVTTAFSGQNLIFVNGAISEATFTAQNFLTAGDSFDIHAFLDGSLFTSASAGTGYQTATFNPGSYQIDAGQNSYADYNGDPRFSGGAGASLIPTAVPEPGSAPLLLTGILGLALTLSRKRSHDMLASDPV